MSELILHIGTDKTGSTSLQKFFQLNADLLLEQGISFPVAANPIGIPERNGDFLISMNRTQCRRARSKEPFKCDVRYAEQMEALVLDACRRADRILFSSEMLWWETPRGKDGSLSGENGALWDAIADWMPQSVERILVVVYPRRQDGYAYSGWKEGVKWGKYTGSFEMNLDDAEYQFRRDYAGMLQLIQTSLEATARPVRFVVRAYMRGALDGGDIFHDFCNACGIAWNEAFSMPRMELNPSLSYDATNAMRALYRTLYKKHPPVMGEFAIMNRLAMKATLGRPDPKDATPLSAKERRGFLERFEESSRLVSERYLDGAPPVWRGARGRARDQAELPAYESDRAACPHSDQDS